MKAQLSIGIIGACPGGIVLGILLARAGFHDFTIFDREDGVGERSNRISQSAVESSRDGGRPILLSHQGLTDGSHTRRPWVTRSLRPAASNTLQGR